jgi:2-amino-4-hydroxy-6-hydroxymethyldihydropteridine diphosphokinase
VWKSNVGGMGDLLQVCLSVGSNLEPARNLRQAVEGLLRSEPVLGVSSAWETRPVGSAGPNFLNACVWMSTRLLPAEFAAQVIHPVEVELKRVRQPDKFAPRTIDVDVILWDGKPAKLENWTHAYTIVPLAELLPDLTHPHTGESLAAASIRLQAQEWIRRRPEVLRGLAPGRRGA